MQVGSIAEDKLFRNQRRILRSFDTHIQNFVKKKLLGCICPICKKLLKILKNVYYKSFLELQFTPTVYTSEPLSLKKA